MTNSVIGRQPNGLVEHNITGDALIDDFDCIAKTVQCCDARGRHILDGYQATQSSSAESR